MMLRADDMIAGLVAADTDTALHVAVVASHELVQQPDDRELADIGPES
jgi:hypothetical protein